MALIEALAIGAGLAAVTLGAMKKIFPAGSGRVDRDTNLLRREVASASQELIPLQKEELKQLAYNREESKAKVEKLSYQRGQLFTVYYEPWAVYAHKSYSSLGKTVATTVVRTRNYEIVYKERGHKNTVEINGELVGLLNGRELIGGKRMTSKLAHIERRPASEYWPIYVGGKEIGGLTNRALTQQPLPRLFQFMTELSRGELAAVLAVVLPELFTEENKA